MVPDEGLAWHVGVVVLAGRCCAYCSACAGTLDVLTFFLNVDRNVDGLSDS